MRINKYLALAGVASRRQCDKLIEDGQIFINEKVAHHGDHVTDSDTVIVNNKKVTLYPKEYYLFNKPIGVLTTLSDPFGRKTIKDFITTIQTRVFPVGRLDFDSHGLILLTNDGDLAHQIQHPKYGVKKVYSVRVDSELSTQEKEKFENGVILEEGKTAKSELQLIGPSHYEVVIHQGWKRQIRRMFLIFEKKVLNLERIKIGPLVLENLKKGELKLLTDKEVKVLKSHLTKKN